MVRIIDASGLILGKLASYVAKRALMGEEIAVVNCEKAIITGSRQSILANYKHKRERGYATKGPFFPRMPDRFVRRTIRGMLPFHQDKGRLAFKRILCYVGEPKDLKGQKETVKEASSENLRSAFLTVGKISELLGAK